MITALPQSSGKTLGFKMSGKLHDEDYQHFVPTVEAAIKANGKVRTLEKLRYFDIKAVDAAWRWLEDN